MAGTQGPGRRGLCGLRYGAPGLVRGFRPSNYRRGASVLRAVRGNSVLGQCCCRTKKTAEWWRSINDASKQADQKPKKQRSGNQPHNTARRGKPGSGRRRGPARLKSKGRASERASGRGWQRAEGAKSLRGKGQPRIHDDKAGGSPNTCRQREISSALSACIRGRRDGVPPPILTKPGGPRTHADEAGGSPNT